MRILESDQLKTIKQKGMPPSCQRFRTMEKHFWVEVEPFNFEARNERTVTGALEKSRSKQKSALTGNRDIFYQWKSERQVYKGETLAVSATITVT